MPTAHQNRACCFWRLSLTTILIPMEPTFPTLFHYVASVCCFVNPLRPAYRLRQSTEMNSIWKDFSIVPCSIQTSNLSERREKSHQRNEILFIPINRPSIGTDDYSFPPSSRMANFVIFPSIVQASLTEVIFEDCHIRSHLEQELASPSIINVIFLPNIFD